MAAAGSTFAQKSKVQAAYNYQKKGVFDKAQEAIELAINHESTKGEAKTWIYRGMVYQGIARSTEEKYAGAKDSALTVAFSSYMKGLELDKEDQRYSGKAIMNMPELHDLAYNNGLDYYNAKNYEKATESFGLAAGAFNFIGQIDTSAVYNAALSADLGGMDSLAIPLYTACTQLGYGEGNTFIQLAQVSKRNDDEEGYLKAINAGLEKYPNNDALIREIANYYITKNDLEKAESYLQKAVEKDPENPLTGENPTLTELIDYEQFCGFGIEKNGARENVKEIDVNTLDNWLKGDEDLQLIDVREPFEYEIVNIDAQLIPQGDILEHVEEISSKHKVVIHCRSGKRSADVIELLQDKYGFQNLYNLKGGILAWAEEIDHSLPKY